MEVKTGHRKVRIRARNLKSVENPEYDPVGVDLELSTSVIYNFPSL
jgi:hypothetical protein